MASRQESRSEETKRAILAATEELFAARGYDAVTIREIAKAAGCSHTTIYIYFKDKEALLHQLSMDPLKSLRQEMESILADSAWGADERLRRISRTFIHFCLANRIMYSIFFMAKAGRVNEAEPLLEINNLRNQLFDLLRRAVQGVLPSRGCTEELVLACARTHFFMLHGIVTTYRGNEEPFDALMERLAPTFDLAVTVMLAGFKQITRTGVGPK
jgi:AcrR family transcriptional regulator